MNHSNDRDGKTENPPNSIDDLVLVEWVLPAQQSSIAGPHLGAVFRRGFEVVDGSTLERGRPGTTVFRIYAEPKNGDRTVHTLHDLACKLAADGVLSTPGEISTHRISNQNWWEAVKDRFPILEIGSFVFVPPWHAPPTPPRPETHVIALEPGEAFGTGHHPTTRLCLQALERLAADPATSNPATILDLGCGSGILALAAARLWSALVTATDVDPAALALTRKNAQKNDLSQRIRTLPTHDVRTETFDLVLANIRYHTLIALADRFPHWVRAQGRVVLSGLLEPETQPFLTAWATHAPGFTLVAHLTETDTSDTWACLIMNRHSPKDEKAGSGHSVRGAD